MKKNSFILLTLIVFLFSCQKEIVIKQPPYDSKFSIQCLIEPDSIPIVFLNSTVPFFSETTNASELVVRNASVKIYTDNVIDVLLLDSTYDKILCKYLYFYKGSQSIQANKLYTLLIQKDAQIYTATTNTNLTAVVIDSVGYTQKFKDIYGEHEGVITYFKDVAAQTNYYRFEMIRPVDSTMKHASIKLYSSCLGAETIVVDELGRSVYNDLSLDGQQIKLVIEPAYSHVEGIETFVMIQTIDKAAYDFYDQLDKQKLAQFNPFVEPIFLKDGQFGSKAIGFFGCKISSQKVSFTFPE